ncbi:hypothetical protein [Mangrovimonas futianensis]|uniref:hypothetical protein n=1 Tax=Mangrovimonas futianensis TaxID=2895523 RepID=UPI001E435027|nr:hypothetical protein [Mangrovimonas futianensis]MCF1423301.1 hypothetical protein [Mangrovimonas futianensis]
MNAQPNSPEWREENAPGCTGLKVDFSALRGFGWGQFSVLENEKERFCLNFALHLKH